MTQLKEETDAAAADDLYDPGDDSDDADDDDADDDDDDGDGDGDGDGDDDDDDDDEDDVHYHDEKKQVVFWNDDDACSHAGCAKSLFRYSGVLIFYSHHEHFSHGREMVVDHVVTICSYVDIWVCLKIVYP